MFALHRINSHATKKFKVGHYSTSFNAFCSVASIGSYHRGFRRAVHDTDKIRYNCYGSNSKQPNASKVDNVNDLHAPPHIEIRGRYFGTPPGIDNMSNTGLMKESYLYGEESNRKSFADIGIIPELCDAVQSVVLNAHTSLSTTSTVHATQIQSACANAIFTGKDVVLAAETGSGKTLAYLVPLVQQCLEFKRKQLQSLDVSYTPYPLAVVLVPNKDLVTQVYSVLTSLLSKLKLKELMSNTETKESNTSLNFTIHAAISPTSANQWPYHLNTFSKTEKTLETHSQLHENVKNVPICYTHSFDLNQTITTDTIAAVEKRSFLPPDITICTPAFLSQIVESATITNSSAKHNRVVSNTDINGVKSNTSNMFEVCQHLRYLVLDEADMLLSGSYLQSMQKLMTILRRTKQFRIKQGSLSVSAYYI